jgi:hypothetical protein
LGSVGLRYLTSKCKCCVDKPKDIKRKSKAHTVTTNSKASVKYLNALRIGVMYTVARTQPYNFMFSLASKKPSVIGKKTTASTLARYFISLVAGAAIINFY